MDNDIYMRRYIDTIMQFIKQEDAEIQMDKPMLEIGINSYEVIEIMIALEEEFNVQFPDSLIGPELFISLQTIYEGLMTLIDENDEK